MGPHSLNLNNSCLSLGLAKNGDQHMYEYKSYPANEVRDTKKTQNFIFGGAGGMGLLLMELKLVVLKPQVAICRLF